VNALAGLHFRAGHKSGASQALFGDPDPFHDRMQIEGLLAFGWYGDAAFNARHCGIRSSHPPCRPRKNLEKGAHAFFCLG
jgi:hypothetical protein